MKNQNTIKINSKTLFEKSKRFDLIFKILYLENIGGKFQDFYKNLYTQSIYYFNEFYEEIPYKNSADDFITHFNDNYLLIKKNGYDVNESIISINQDGDLWDGAHRLSICAHLNLDVEAQMVVGDIDYDYNFFSKRGMPSWLSDYGALEFVLHSKFAHVATVHSCVEDKFDENIDELISKYAKKYYCKKIFLNRNGYINLKKISYKGSDWIGSKDNLFKGAEEHYEQSKGDYPIRAYVIISENVDDLIILKSKIRDLVGLNNFSIHITDTQEESIDLAKVLFSSPTLKFISDAPIDLDFNLGDGMIKEYYSLLNSSAVRSSDYCVVGSYPMSLYGIRVARDLDYINLDGSPIINSPIIDMHHPEDNYFISDTSRVILDPRMHFYYLGVKFYTLEMLLSYKSRRLEIPKDYEDNLMILDYLNSRRSDFSGRSSMVIKYEHEVLIPYRSISIILFKKIKHHIGIKLPMLKKMLIKLREVFK